MPLQLYLKEEKEKKARTMRVKKAIKFDWESLIFLRRNLNMKSKFSVFIQSSFWCIDNELTGFSSENF